MKSIVQKLVNNGKYDFAHNLLIEFRSNSGLTDFYSLEMGTFFGMRMDFEKAVQEYLLYLTTHPNQLQSISDRIMIFPDDPSIITVISSILQNSKIQNQKKQNCAGGGRASP